MEEACYAMSGVNPGAAQACSKVTKLVISAPVAAAVATCAVESSEEIAACSAETMGAM